MRSASGSATATESGIDRHEEGTSPTNTATRSSCQMADLSSTCGLIGDQMLRGCDIGLAVVAEAASPNNSDSVMRWRAVQ